MEYQLEHIDTDLVWSQNYLGPIRFAVKRSTLDVVDKGLPGWMDHMGDTRYEVGSLMVNKDMTHTLKMNPLIDEEFSDFFIAKLKSVLNHNDVLPYVPEDYDHVHIKVNHKMCTEFMFYNKDGDSLRLFRIGSRDLQWTYNQYDLEYWFRINKTEW